MKTKKAIDRMIGALAFAIALVCTFNVQASWIFKFPAGEDVGYWDDPERWTGDGGVHQVPTTGDGRCEYGGTIFITNQVPYIWEFALTAPTNLAPLKLHIKSGGQTGTGTGWTSLKVGKGAGRQGQLQIDSGGKFIGALVVGAAGYGVATNQGNITYSGTIVIGNDAGSYGKLVCCDGGTLTQYYAKDLYVGRKGHGELHIENSDVSWHFYAHNNGDIVVGESAEKGQIFIGQDGSFKSQWMYLGGRDAGSAGYGELILRGGTYINNSDNPNGNMLFQVGVCPDGNGGYDEASYGVIRGWGEITGADTSRISYRGIRALIGRGEIVGDGEGDESHELRTQSALYGVTNAFVVASDTWGDGNTVSGWRARNKGMVILSPYGSGWNGDVHNVNVGYAGCMLPKDVDGLSPNLVNAVRVKGWNTQAGQNKYIGAAVLAPDRTDAYTNALPTGCNVLSIHKIGFFKQEAARGVEDRSPCGRGNVAIRYDQTKMSGSADSRLELWRYTVASGRWTRLVRLAAGERPADKVIAMDSSDSFDGNLDERFNLGTFAVVERETMGMSIIFR